MSQHALFSDLFLCTAIYLRLFWPRWRVRENGHVWKWVFRRKLEPLRAHVPDELAVRWLWLCCWVTEAIGCKGKGGVEGQGSVHGAPRDEVDNWVWNKHCQQLGKPPFQMERQTGENGAQKRGKRWGGGREKERKSQLPSWGKSCYWKAIKLAFSRIDWKWRGLLKERDKGTIARLWPPYVALLSASFFTERGATLSV